jgi:5'-3' exonuclease
MLLIVDGDPVVFRSSWNRNSLEETRERYEEMIDDIAGRCFADEIKVAVWGDNNFRLDFYHDYKNTPNRIKSKERNLYFMDMRHELVADGKVTPADGMEADDLVRIWAEEARAEGKDFVIASIDKDLLCIEGAHYLIHRDEFKHMDKETADEHYWTQVLTGDSVDNIQGIKGIGPKKAQKILAGAKFGERKQRVIDAYYEHYGSNWKEKMVHCGTLVHIMPTRDGVFSLDEKDAPTEVLDGEESS